MSSSLMAKDPGRLEATLGARDGRPYHRVPRLHQRRGGLVGSIASNSGTCAAIRTSPRSQPNRTVETASRGLTAKDLPGRAAKRFDNADAIKKSLVAWRRRRIFRTCIEASDFHR
ncbi:MAG: hypothetical protein U5O39_06095 [Gammaproteobacteria bacterium]|nr:hypothetical protein [Gammaproteobacteria bacterium]